MRDAAGRYYRRESVCLGVKLQLFSRSGDVTDIWCSTIAEYDEAWRDHGGRGQEILHPKTPFRNYWRPKEKKTNVQG